MGHYISPLNFLRVDPDFALESQEFEVKFFQVLSESEVYRFLQQLEIPLISMPSPHSACLFSRTPVGLVSQCKDPLRQSQCEWRLSSEL